MTPNTQRRIYALLGVAALALTSAACSDGGSTTDKLDTPECVAFKDYAGIAGKTVTIYASIRDTEEDLLKQSWKAFEDCTGVKINYEGSGEFETQLKVRVDGGRAPDIAFIPQPGTVTGYAKSGTIKPAGALAKTASTANYSADWLKYSTVDGVLYGAPLGSNVKSFVWYSPKTFSDNGWTIQIGRAHV